MSHFFTPSKYSVGQSSGGDVEGMIGRWVGYFELRMGSDCGAVAPHPARAGVLRRDMMPGQDYNVLAL